jgi:two-component sensor histidine kinase
MGADEQIGELQEQLRQTELAMEEMNHRFRNQLQIISNLLDIQAAKSGSSETVDALRQCRARVGSIAMVHDMLRVGGAQAVEMDEYLQALVVAIAAAWKGDDKNVSVKVEAARVMMKPARAAVVGLVVTELVTNAFKHAFVAGGKGQMAVCLKDEGGEVSLSVADDGRGMPEGVRIGDAASGGLRLVRALVGQLKGQVESAVGQGTKVTVIFPE